MNMPKIKSSILEEDNPFWTTNSCYNFKHSYTIHKYFIKKIKHKNPIDSINDIDNIIGFKVNNIRDNYSYPIYFKPELVKKEFNKILKYYPNNMVITILTCKYTTLQTTNFKNAKSSIAPRTVINNIQTFIENNTDYSKTKQERYRFSYAKLNEYQKKYNYYVKSALKHADHKYLKFSRSFPIKYRYFVYSLCCYHDNIYPILRKYPLFVSIMIDHCNKNNYRLIRYVKCLCNNNIDRFIKIYLLYKYNKQHNICYSIDDNTIEIEDPINFNYKDININIELTKLICSKIKPLNTDLHSIIFENLEYLKHLESHSFSQRLFLKMIYNFKDDYYEFMTNNYIIKNFKDIYKIYKNYFKLHCNVHIINSIYKNNFNSNISNDDEFKIFLQVLMIKEL